MKKPYENYDEKKWFKLLSNRIFNNAFQWEAALTTFDAGLEEKDYSLLTAETVLHKIKSFLDGKPNETQCAIFLEYLSRFPVSMCQRDVSDILVILIGFHYHSGIPSQEDREKGIEPVSYQDLSTIFARSKSTIAEALDRFKPTWNEFQVRMEQEQRIEERVIERLAAEKRLEQDVAAKAGLTEEKTLEEEQYNEQTNERT